MQIVDETTVEWVRHPIRPEHIDTNKGLWGAFKTMGADASATWIIRLCQQTGQWHPFTYNEINRLYRGRTSLKDDFQFNGLLIGGLGLIIESTPVGRYHITHEFICQAFAAAPAPELKLRTA